MLDACTGFWPADTAHALKGVGFSTAAPWFETRAHDLKRMSAAHGAAAEIVRPRHGATRSVCGGRVR
jgi:hypothetical protein